MSSAIRSSGVPAADAARGAMPLRMPAGDVPGTAALALKSAASSVAPTFSERTCLTIASALELRTISPVGGARWTSFCR